MEVFAAILREKFDECYLGLLSCCRIMRLLLSSLKRDFRSSAFLISPSFDCFWEGFTRAIGFFLFFWVLYGKNELSVSICLRKPSSEIFKILKAFYFGVAKFVLGSDDSYAKCLGLNYSGFRAIQFLFPLALACYWYISSFIEYSYVSIDISGGLAVILTTLCFSPIPFFSI